MEAKTEVETQIIKTDLAPSAVGTYSQGVVYNGIYYFSGQIGLNPKDNQISKDFERQAKQVLSNIDGLLESCGLTRRHILKTTIFLIDLKEFAKVNTLYQEYFTPPYPARSCVEVSRLPKDALIEIEVIARQL